MKKRIIAILLAGMMTFSSMPVYADTDVFDDSAEYAENVESNSEETVSAQSESAEVAELAEDTETAGADESSESEEETMDVFSDEAEADLPEEDSEIEITEEAEDVFSEYADSTQTDSGTASDGTLANGVKWSLSAAGTLHISGSGAIETGSGETYPWDKTKVVSLEIEKGITAIGSEAFASCEKLKKVSIGADTLQSVSEDAFKDCSSLNIELYYAGNAPGTIPAFANAASEKVYYKENNETWTDEYREVYTDVEWIPYCTLNGLAVNTQHSYVRDSDEVMVQTDGNTYPTQENMAYYATTCSVCGNHSREYNDCIHCIDTEELQSDHPYGTETTTEWTVSMQDAEEIIMTFHENTRFETNYDDFFYIYDENGELYQKFINEQLAGKTVVVPGSSATLKLTTDYNTEEWGFAVTKAYGTTHKWNNVVTKPAERDQTGTLTKTCQKCGEVIEEVIPAPYIVCGDDGNIFWGITPDGVLEIAPNTDQKESMKSYSGPPGNEITDAPWGEYRKYFEGVRIKKGITDIGSSGFYGLGNLKWAELDDDIKTIDYRAFSDCKALEKVKLPANLVTIESNAFSGCKILEKIELPEKLTTIRSGAFSDTGLRSIRMPASLKRCDQYAFGSSNIDTVYIEDLTSWLSMEEGPNFFSSEDLELSSKSPTIKYYVDGELLERLVIPDEITSIRDYAFNCGKEIREVVFHENVKTIGRGAFLGCENLELTRDKLPNYLQTIGAYAFAKCKKISNVGIPSSVTEIGEAAFAMCSGMTQCIFAQDIQIEKIPKKLFQGCTSLEKTTIPAGVTIIEEYAFENCEKLERITIPATVIMISDGAFNYCSNLKEVEFTKDSKLKNIGVNSSVFGGCLALKSIRIPAGVSSMGRSAFSGSVDELIFLGDFNNFNYLFEMDNFRTRKITYYACNDTWNSSEAQNFLSNSSYNITPNPIHMSTESTSLTPATCTEAGERTFVCDHCNKSFTEVLPATGHKLTLKEHKDATCIEKGYDIQVCSNCKKEFRTELETDPTAHQYDDGTVIEPTCSREGYTVYTCQLCKNTKHEDYKPRTEHAYEDTVVKPTCQMQGYTIHQCKNCDYSYTDTWTEPLEHDYEATVKAPTCTERGYTYYSCKNCGYSYRDNYVGAQGHKYTKTVTAPTCTAEGYTENTCSDCGVSYISNYKEATGHDYDVKVTAPTCTEKGYTTYTCKNCDNVVVTDYRNPLGHNYEAVTTDSTCTNRGFTTYTCLTCGNSYVGDETELAPHKWDNGTVTEKATYLKKGTKEFKCTDCDAHYTEDIPALEQTALSDCAIILSYRRTVYNGKEKTPKVTVRNNEGIVSEDNYTVAYADNLNAGEATVTITANSGDVCITGTVEKTFTISKAKQTVIASCTDESIHVKTPTEIEVNGIGEITFETDDTDLVEIKENNQIIGKKAGLAVITVSASGYSNHEPASTTVAVGVEENHIISHKTEKRTTMDNGDVEYDDVQLCTLCNDEITREHKTLTNIKRCEIRLAAASYVFKGEAVKPEVYVSLNGAALKEGEDYLLEYRDNTKTGKGTVAITGIGNYTNTEEKTFQIVTAPKPVVLATGKITSAANAAKGIKLTWQKINGAQGYIIYRAYGNGSYKAIKTITNAGILAYTDTTATVNGGKYTYAVCGYRGSTKGKYTGKTCYRLAQNKLSSVKSDASGKMTVKWKKNTKATGYEICYITGKKQKTVTVKSNKTLSKVIKSLKKKATYSVKVRGYKTVSGVKYYSEWSPVKKVKIRK